MQLCVPKIVSLTTMGSQFIYKWDYTLSYQFRPQTSLSSSPKFPSVSQCFPSISCSLTFPLSKMSNLPCPLTSTPSYSPFLVVWLSLPSPLTHTFPFLLDSQGILTNSEDFLRTCFRRQIVFRSGPFQNHWSSVINLDGLRLTLISFVVSQRPTNLL